MDRDLIEQYANGGPLLTTSVADLTEADLQATPGPGRWSIRQVVVHLLDSDLVGGERMKRVIAMEEPTLLAYDQDAFVERLNYQTADLNLVGSLFHTHRLLIAELLRTLPDEVFQRRGLHDKDGPLTLQQLILKYIRHLEHHLDFLRQKRANLGKPL